MSSTTDYSSMWRELGLDLEKHDALMQVPGQAYGDIFLSQQQRPEGMGYFDFVMSEVHGLRIKGRWTCPTPRAQKGARC